MQDCHTPIWQSAFLFVSILYRIIRDLSMTFSKIGTERKNKKCIDKPREWVYNNNVGVTGDG